MCQSSQLQASQPRILSVPILAGTSEQSQCHDLLLRNFVEIQHRRSSLATIPEPEPIRDRPQPRQKTKELAAMFEYPQLVISAEHRKWNEKQQKHPEAELNV